MQPSQLPHCGPGTHWCTDTQSSGSHHSFLTLWARHSLVHSLQAAITASSHCGPGTDWCTESSGSHHSFLTLWARHSLVHRHTVFRPALQPSVRKKQEILKTGTRSPVWAAWRLRNTAG
ncbi:hypothetical protein ACOMHN_012937 [Nucella lapillus]